MHEKDRLGTIRERAWLEASRGRGQLAECRGVGSVAELSREVIKLLFSSHITRLSTRALGTLEANLDWLGQCGGEGETSMR